MMKVPDLRGRYPWCLHTQTTSPLHKPASQRSERNERSEDPDILVRLRSARERSWAPLQSCPWDAPPAGSGSISQNEPTERCAAPHGATISKTNPIGREKRATRRATKPTRRNKNQKFR